MIDSARKMYLSCSTFGIRAGNERKPPFQARTTGRVAQATSPTRSIGNQTGTHHLASPCLTNGKQFTTLASTRCQFSPSSSLDTKTGGRSKKL